MDTATEPDPGALALPIGGDQFELTGLARGPWQPDAAHGGAPTALLARAIEAHDEEGRLRLVSMSSTFHGPVLLGAVEVETEVVKPGRLQKVVAARLRSGGRVVIEARGVLLRRGAVELPGTVEAPGPVLPPPEECSPVEGGAWASGGELAFHRDANTILVVEGGPEAVRHTGTAWFRLDCPVVPGEPPSPAQRASAAGDFGNGLAHPVAFGEYLFVNCDLNVSLFRDPVDEWIGIVARTEVDPVGAGLTVTGLHDRRGRFGAATQALYVDHVPG